MAVGRSGALHHEAGTSASDPSRPTCTMSASSTREGDDAAARSAAVGRKLCAALVST